MGVKCCGTQRASRFVEAEVSGSRNWNLFGYGALSLIDHRQFFPDLMMMRSKRKNWSQEDCDRLRELVASGASPLRASLALKRSLAVTKNKARDIGAPFRTESELKKERRQILE